MAHRHNPRRWLPLVVAWLVVACIATLDALATRDYVAMLDDSGTLPTRSLPLHRPAPSDYHDTYTWTRYALALRDQPSIRIRRTDIDNAPVGRAVHWNSALVHVIALSGQIRAALFKEPIAAATEQALAWINLPLFLVVVIAFSAWTARRLGAPVGVALAFAMIGHRWFYDGFAPNNVDHHGVITAATFGLILGIVFMGVGWVRGAGDDSLLLPNSLKQARIAAVISGLCGGVGLWVSAASTVPIIAFVGIGGALSGLVVGRAALARGEQFDAQLWRLWGAVGCAASLVAYVAEYAPHDLGLRLEVNHPLYALAWLGGSELVAAIIEWRVFDKRPVWWRSAIAAVCLLAPIAVIVAAGPRVFVPLDPRAIAMHAHIKEFLSLPAFVRATGGVMAWRFVLGFVLTLSAFFIVRLPRDRTVFAFVSTVAVAALILACWQVRWWLVASGAQLCVALVTLAVFSRQWTTRRQWLTVALISAFFVEQAGARVRLTRSNVEQRAVSPADALEPMYRDAAVAVRASNPNSHITLLASPNASTAMGYFGDFQTLASLYWENLSGVEAAAQIFSATTEDEAHRLLSRRGVTHIAVFSSDDFLLDFLRIVRPKATSADLGQTFGIGLLSGHEFPRWLKPIPFRPRIVDPTGERPMLFELVEMQTDIEAAWNAAVAQVACGRSEDAEAEFRRAASLVAPAQRARMYQNAGESAYQWGDHALAVRLLVSADSLGTSAEVDANLAWILATSTDDRVRDGRAALERADRLAKHNALDLTALDVLGAALAETGRFAEASDVAQRMLSVARSAGDAAGENRARTRLAAYASGHPWRQ